MAKRKREKTPSPAPPQPAPSPPRHPLLLVLGAGLLVCLAAAYLVLRPGGGPGGLGQLPGGLAPGRLNLVVVTLDTLRADRLGCYGSRDVETPHLDALAARGTLFENAISPTPLTLPAHASLFTGLQPGGHGVRDNGGFHLAAERLTLAEILQQNGWATGGFIAAYVLDHRWGIAQGFEHYRDDFDLSKYKSVSMGDIQRRGDEVVADGLEWIADAARGDQPFFAWIHLYDPHTPYSPPEPFASRYAGRPYNGEVAWTDELVGRLTAGLDHLGLTERTVVAVIGDHGESLGEHGETGHGYFLYEPTTRVPFLLAGPYPGLAGRRVPGVVRHVDLLPTLLELLGVGDGVGDGSGDRPKIAGQSLVPLILGRPDAPAIAGYSEAFYARYHYGWSELRAVRTARWHFIEAPRPELYDLAADPGEQVNLADRERRTVADLRRQLARIEDQTGPPPAAAAPLEEDEETLRKLAALGYVGSRVETDKSWRDLPDPKDRIEVYNLMDRARDEIIDGAADRAIATLREVLAQDSEVIDAWFMLGNAWFQKHDWGQAAAAYRKTLEKKPDHDYAMIGLADTLVATNRVDDAVLGYERYLSRDPNNAQVTYRLAQVLLDAGRNEAAEKSFLRTLQIEPKTARAEVGRAVVAFRAKDLQGSRRAIERALRIDPQAGHARYNLALILETEGDLAGAAAAYRAEIAARPTAYKAHFNLGRLLARQGDRQGAATALARAVEENPDFGVGHLFLAQARLAAGDLAGAAEEARRGLALDPTSTFAPLGHYVLADVYNRQGNPGAAAAEAAKGKALEAKGGGRG
jgi:choline-sulfatase